MLTSADGHEINLEFPLSERQEQALYSEATEIFFGGATEGGKSHLGRIALIVWCLGIPGLQCVLIRKKFDDIRRNHIYGRTGFLSLLDPLIKRRLVEVTREEIRFKNGSVIAFQHCQDERQFDSAQGVEKHVIFIDEAPQVSERLIRTFRAWCRMSEEMKETLPEEFRGMFPRILYTGNPIGASIAFFRREFVEARPPFHIDHVAGFKRQFIPSLPVDNPYADLVALQGRLEGLGDPALAKALREGNFHTPIGDFFKMYSDKLTSEGGHVCHDFQPPEWWFKFATFDWGLNDPFCVSWWTISDGEDFTDEYGRDRWFPRDALIGYREWYGCDPAHPSRGLGDSIGNADIARGILERMSEKLDAPIISDSVPFRDMGHRKNNRVYTIADTFADEGCPLVQGNSSRIYGASQIATRLLGSDGIPMLYLCESMRYTREYLAAVERDPKNPETYVDSGEATHTTDCVKLACTTRPKAKDKPIPTEFYFPSTDNSISPNKILKKLKHGTRRKRRGR